MVLKWQEQIQVITQVSQATVTVVTFQMIVNS